MRLNRKYKGLTFPKAFNLILEKSRAGGLPILIVRSDVFKEVCKMRRLIENLNDCTYIKLGVVCSMDKIYRILFEKFCNGEYVDNKDKLVNLIVKSIRNRRGRNLVIIDNCQYILFPNVFRLTGLILELSGEIQFIFLLPDDHLAKWRLFASIKETIFLKMIPLKYDFS